MAQGLASLTGPQWLLFPKGRLAFAVKSGPGVADRGSESSGDEGGQRKLAMNIDRG